jgi:hypothetical protein
MASQQQAFGSCPLDEDVQLVPPEGVDSIVLKPGVAGNQGVLRGAGEWRAELDQWE